MRLRLNVPRCRADILGTNGSEYDQYFHRSANCVDLTPTGPGK